MQLRRTGRASDKGFKCISLQDERHQSGRLSRVDGNAQLSKAPFDRMRLGMGDRNSCRANATFFFMNQPDKQTRLKTARFSAGPFNPTRVQNRTMALSFISALRMGKYRWNLSSIYHLPNSNSLLFYVNTHEETELNIILMKISKLRPHFWSLLNKNCRLLVIKLLLNIPFLFFLIF